MSISVSGSYNYAGLVTVRSSVTDAADSQKAAVNQLVNEYTYMSNGVLKPKLDKNDDSLWSEDELQNYADALQKATGRSLDVSALLEKYGNGDGRVGAKGQKEMLSDDALQLSGLQIDWIKANANTTAASAASGAETNAEGSLTDLLDSMSGAEKTSFSLAVQRTELQQGLLAGFVNGADSDMLNLLNSQSNLMMYSTALRAGGKNTEFFSSVLDQMMNSIG